MYSQARGLLGRAGARPCRVSTEGQGTRRSGVEAGWHWVGGTDERWGLLQGRSGLQEAGLLLEWWGLAVQGGRGWEGGAQKGRGLVKG